MKFNAVLELRLEAPDHEAADKLVEDLAKLLIELEYVLMVQGEEVEWASV